MPLTAGAPQASPVFVFPLHGLFAINPSYCSDLVSRTLDGVVPVVPARAEIFHPSLIRILVPIFASTLGVRAQSAAHADPARIPEPGRANRSTNSDRRTVTATRAAATAGGLDRENRAPDSGSPSASQAPPRCDTSSAHPSDNCTPSRLPRGIVRGPVCVFREQQSP